MVDGPVGLYLQRGNERDEERKQFAQMSSDVELYPSMFGIGLHRPNRVAQYLAPMPRINTKLIQTRDIRDIRL
jgi:hypothetical protein